MIVIDNCKTFVKTSEILKVVHSRPPQEDKKPSNGPLYSYR